MTLKPIIRLPFTPCDPHNDKLKIMLSLTTKPRGATQESTLDGLLREALLNGASLKASLGCFTNPQGIS